MQIEETPTISNSYKKMELSQFELCIDDFDNNYFATFFILKGNAIQIKCNQIDSNEKYIRDVSLDDWKYINNYFCSFRNIKEIFERLRKLKNNDYMRKKEKSLISLKMKFYDRLQNYSATININEIKDDKSEEFKPNEIMKENKNNENLIKRIEILEDFINKLKKSLPFNSIDLSLYELENVFNNLDSKELISKKENLGLINSGIKKLFKQNISDCILTYKFTTKDNNDIPNIFRTKCEGFKNNLIIIKSMNDKIFGFFYKEENNNNNYWAGDFQNIETIFDTRNYSSNSFVFSFSKDKIYYSDNSQKDLYESPGFSLKFNYNRKSFFGNEYKNKKIDYSNLYEDRERVQNYPNIQQQQCGYQVSMNNPQKIYTTTTRTTIAENYYQNANIQPKIQQKQHTTTYPNKNRIVAISSSNQYFQP